MQEMPIFFWGGGSLLFQERVNGKATNFKFCTNIHSQDESEHKHIKILEKEAVGGLLSFHSTSRGHLCDSTAILL